MRGNTRSRRLLRPLLLALVALATSGCLCSEDKKQAKPEKEIAAQATNAKRAENKDAPVRPDLQDIEVPTSEQFEEEADKTITVDNMESELDRLEKEIGE